ncbi:phage baseplate assembly protein V [Microbacterium thalassium]|uniref:Gp5/Type VI secretion system Vgr protein OB-fold domain-containing protein n=1 Tax=Microbacterium thalassium TaxID=362649 RepID=A0A7X0FR85_9MICO|nr:phage baseplate assembly protein V [Microbacterium thalassium]MBB6392225.1 hypothetical protein [Microbacterium thalassium]GLK23436.1 hypothetical protein GCM10017607_07540 [Microbacterium thalassium]
MPLHRATVLDSADPLGLGRLSVDVPSVGVASIWALPVIPFGARRHRPPEPGTAVWIEFEEGDLSRPVVLGTIPTPE